MDLAVFQELTEQITLECFFMTDSQQEEKVIQLIDLHHFIECYNPDIKILASIHYPVNIIEEKHNRKEFYFTISNIPQHLILIILNHLKNSISCRKCGLYL